MPKIYTVQLDGTISDADKLLGSDSAVGTQNHTRNFAISSLKSHILTTGADLTITGNAAIGGTLTATGNTTLSSNLTVGGNLSVTGDATIAGNLTFGDADTDTVSFGADIVSDIIPDVTNTYNLGSSSKKWRNLDVAGYATIGGININNNTGELSGVVDLYAQKIYDSNDSNYILDLTATDSLIAKGNIQLGNLTGHAETASQIKAYGDLILKADSDADGGYKRGEEIFRTRGANDGGVAVEFNKDQYDESGNLLDTSVFSTIQVGDVIYNLGTGPNNQNVTSAPVSQIIGWQDTAGNVLGTDPGNPPNGSVKWQVYVNTAISYSSNSYLTVLPSGAVNDGGTVDRKIKFFSGATETGSIDHHGNLTLAGSLIVPSLDISGDIDVDGTANLDVVDVDGNSHFGGADFKIEASNSIKINNTNTTNGVEIGNGISGMPVTIGHGTSEVTIGDNLTVTGTLNGITINKQNQEMSGIGNIYAHKFFDSQDDNYYIDPGNSGTSINVAGQITCAGNASLGGISINSSNREVSGVGELYAYKFIDSQTGSHYLDPGNSTLSLVTAGKVTIGAFTIPKTIGSAGQVLKVPSSGTELEWGTTSGIPHKLSGTDFTNSLFIGHSTTGTLNQAMNNTAVGYKTLEDLTTGDSNNAFGYKAGQNNLAGEHNIFIGEEAGGSLRKSHFNVYVGSLSGRYVNDSSASGNVAGNNTFVGNKSGYGVSGSTNHNAISNTGVGANAMELITTGKENTVVGKSAGAALSSGTGNVFIGFDAGKSVTTGNDNIIIGSESDMSTSKTGTIVIGHAIPDNFVGNNETRIGHTNTVKAQIPALFKNNKFYNGGGATSITTSDSGSVYQINSTTDGTFTLPNLTAAPTGMQIDILFMAHPATTEHKIVTANTGTQEFIGSIMIVDTDTNDAVTVIAAQDADNYSAFKFNGSTTGIKGTKIRLTAVSSSKWFIEGTVLVSGTPGNPLATS